MNQSVIRWIVRTLIAASLAILGYIGLMAPQWNDRNDGAEPGAAEMSAAPGDEPFPTVSTPAKNTPG